MRRISGSIRFRRRTTGCRPASRRRLWWLSAGVAKPHPGARCYAGTISGTLTPALSQKEREVQNRAPTNRTWAMGFAASIEGEHRTDGFTGLHRAEGFVNIIKPSALGNHLIELEPALAVEVQVARHVDPKAI